MKNRLLAVGLVAALLSIWAGRADAWLRMRYEDAQVVERSELIVVGSIKEGSVVVVPHRREPPGGRSWETNAVLVVHDVVKGESKEKELPIVIGYGLDVAVDGSVNNRGALEEPTKLEVKGAISIMDTGNSGWSGVPVVKDAREQNLWCLRRGVPRTMKDNKAFGIGDPEDVQPLRLRKYLESYQKADTDAAVRAALQEQPEIGDRALRYLQHRAVTEILKLKDAGLRVEQLLPYYQNRVTWGYKAEAREGIIAAGDIAGPYLMALYGSTYGEPQVDILRMWGLMRYKGCVETLIDVLKKEDLYWATQTLKPGWWNAEVESALTQRRRESYGMVYAAAHALSEIRDPLGREALELTRKRWATINFENPQIVETCDAALKTMGPK